ncbi:MAG: TonB-dependent receptor [Calditrichaeota bacterium]|nr:MAG: TonB-dependent receptor [Calditrichota bacterium]
MSMKNNLVLTLSIFFSATLSIQAQDYLVIAHVKDTNTHQEIEAVNVFIEGARRGTVSNKDGRFRLDLNAGDMGKTVIFQHIGYHILQVDATKLRKMDVVYLQPRVIPMQGIEVEGASETNRIKLDIPQAIEVIDASAFEIRGYVDAGDLLKTDHSVQVSEDLSGRKTVTIRGGNADEVVVLYNGVKLNSSLDNVFDMSLIDLKDVKSVEVIKGSNTALYGPEAFSGVVNIIPKTDFDYNIRFQQRLGTYRSGNWGLHLHKKLGNYSGYYSIKRGGLERLLEDGVLENLSTHNTGHLTYSFENNAKLNAMFVSTDLDYYRTGSYAEDVSSMNTLGSLHFNGNLGFLTGLDISASYKELDENQDLRISATNYTRDLFDESWYLNLQKSQDMKGIEYLVGYQMQHSNLDYNKDLVFYQFQRQTHGFVAIAKTDDEPGSDFFKNVRLNLSIRHDIIDDEQKDTSAFNLPGSTQDDIYGTNSWQESTAKFAMNLYGFNDELVVNSYVSFGANVKFPSLIQQISTPSDFARDATAPNMEPEKDRSLELTTTITRDLGKLANVSGWQAGLSYFQNFYDNKFRMLSPPFSRVPVFDNVKTASIKGLEGSMTVFFFTKKISTEYGLSKYFISEKSSFPFKSDFKQTINLSIDHYGYSFQLHWFKENEQIAWLPASQTGSNPDIYTEVELPAFDNIDIHLSKTFDIKNFQFFLNFSGRNLLNDDTVLQGIAIRDKRFYVTFGSQY